MKKLFLLLATLLSLHATHYVSWHQTTDAYGDTGFINQADKMLALSKTAFPAKYSSATYYLYLTDNLHATKELEDGSMCTNADFHHFKVYIPVGTEYMALSFGGIGNPGYVINYTYKPNTIDHANMVADWRDSNQLKIFNGEGNITGYTMSRDGTKSIVTPKPSPFVSTGGWLYVDVIRGNEFSSSSRDSGNQAREYLLQVTLDIKISDESAFLAWLTKAKLDYRNKAYKIIQPNGDPYDDTNSIDIISNDCRKGILSERISVLKAPYAEQESQEENDDINTCLALECQDKLNAILFDVNNDGIEDRLIKESPLTLELLDSEGNVTQVIEHPYVSSDWNLSHLGDLNGDSIVDYIWQNITTNKRYVWFMDANHTKESGAFLPVVDALWEIQEVFDTNNDGIDDFIWRNSQTGQVVIWLNNGTTHTTILHPKVANAWQIIKVGDLNGDGEGDFVWQNSDNGMVVAWINNQNQHQTLFFSRVLGDWKIDEMRDVNADGIVDIVWENQNTEQKVAWILDSALKKVQLLLL